MWYAKEKDLLQHRLGDTWDGMNCRVVRNGNPDITNADIKVEFRLGNKTGTVEKTCTVGSGITKTDAADGRFKIDAFRVMFTKPGTIYYDVQFKEGSVYKTYIYGKWPIEQGVTQTA